VFCYSSSPKLTNCILSDNTQHAVHEADSASDPAVSHCLFANNPQGDYYDEDTNAMHSVLQFGSILPLGSVAGCFDGDPKFVMAGPSAITGAWSGPASYSAPDNRTTLTNSAAGFTPGALVGRLINADTSQRSQALVVANTATTVEVVGNVTVYVANGDVYTVVDYHLRDGSAAIDRGTLAGAPATDIDGDARPGVGGQVDIGIDEAPAGYTPISTGTIYYAAATRPNDSGDGLSWPTAKKTVSAALALAQYGDQVWIKAGTYRATTDAYGNAAPFDARTKTHTLKSGVNVYGGFNGSETALAQRNVAANISILSGDLNGNDVGFANNSDNSYHVVSANGVNHSVLDGVTVTAGNADGTSTPEKFGGGISCTGVNNTNTLVNCTVIANSAITGSGVLCDISSPALTNCTVTGNSADGVFCSQSSPTLTGCTVSDNSGTGVLCFLYSAPTLTNCTVNDNSDRGVDCGFFSSLTLTDCTVSGNSAGGVSCSFYGTATLTGCTVSSNSNSGVSCSYYASATLTDCTISGNRTSYQGGGLNGNAGASLTLTNCAVSGNRASSGGGLWCAGNPWVGNSELSMTNCTVSDNVASAGGGLWFASTSPELVNCIFHDNTSQAIYKFAPLSAADQAMLASLPPEVLYAFEALGFGLIDDSRAAIIHCLFYGNPNGDVCVGGSIVVTGATAINALVGNSGNVTGNPKFVMDGPAGTTGTWTAPASYNAPSNRTTLTNAAAAFVPGALAGQLINVDTSQPLQTLVAANSATTVEVVGNVAAYAGSGDTYRLVDYHLRNGSAALDRGRTAGAPTTDFDGDARPGSDSLVDIGADEADGSFVPGTGGLLPVSYAQVSAAARFGTFSVFYHADSAMGGVRSVRLFYRRNGGDWTEYGTSFTASPIDFDTSTTGGPGVYEFYTQAMDNNGNEEEPHAVPDGQTVVITSFIGSRVYVDDSATGTQTGADWANALHSLQAGLTVATAFSVSQIWVATGRYLPSQDGTGNPAPTDPRTCTFALPSDVELFGGFSGTEALLSERPNPGHPTLLSGDLGTVGDTSDNSYHVVTLNGTYYARLDGFTVTSGNAAGNYPNNQGGGVYCYDVNGTNTLANCMLIDNNAGYGGGGLYCYGSALVLNACVLSGNHAVYGAGMSCDASAPVLNGCTLNDNRADSQGGGLYYNDNTTMVLVNCMVSGNSAIFGGGLLGNANTTSLLTNCTFSSNTASLGGGVFCNDGATGVLTNCLLSDNTGHGVYEYTAAADLTVTHCLFNANPNGDYWDEGTTSLTGAALINAIPDGQATGNVDGDPTFAMNGPGGITGSWTAAPSYDALLDRTILTTGADTFTPDALAGQFINADTSQRRQALIIGNTDTQVAVWGDHSYAGGGAGGPAAFRVIDYRLDSGSAAIDTGTAGASVPATDIAGDLRPIDIPNQGANGTATEFDIGAYEVVTVAAPQLPGLEMFFTQALQPPPQAMLACRAPWQTQFANGVIFRDLRLSAFTAGFPLPAMGATDTQSMGCEAMLDVSSDGGTTFLRVQCAAQMTVRTTGRPETNGTQFFDTEMLQLDLSGGALPAGMMLRESPSKASLGRMTVRLVPGGYMISSFFDIFTEVSLDGGQNWSPSPESWRFELRRFGTTVSAIGAPTRLLPSPMAQYASAPDQTLQFTNGALVSNVSQTQFSAAQLPPISGTIQRQSLDAVMRLKLSLDEGQSFLELHGACSMVISRACADSGANGLLDTEMVSLDFTDMEWPPYVMLRESPTRPSRGITRVQAQPDGTFRIQSFFDVFFEISQDGGQSWAASNEPLRLEAIPVATSNPFPTSGIPPSGSVYADPSALFAAFSGGVLVRHLNLHDFLDAIPLPAPDASATRVLNASVDFELSRNGGLSWDRYACVAFTTLRVSSSTDSGSTRYFDTEMLSLLLTGGSLPAGIMLRESPTRASTGRTSVTGNPMSGPFFIDSFFDVFTELSVDGGQTWLPASTSGLLRLEPTQSLTMTCPDDITLAAPDASGAVVSYAAPVTEGGCAPVTVTSVPPSGSRFPVGVTTVVSTATDACGQTAECRFTVTVQPSLTPGFEMFFPDALLLPPQGLFVSMAPWQSQFANGVVLSDLRLRAFTGGLPPPAPGTSTTESIGCEAMLDLSLDGGATFQAIHCQSQMTLRTTGGTPTGTVQFFDTEMLRLDFFSGNLPASVQLRESPTRASLGGATLRTVPGGCMISSFFDIFTELSLDGGQTWLPAADSCRVELRRDPTTVAVLQAPTPLLPSPMARFASAPEQALRFNNGTVLRHLRQTLFSTAVSPPAPGADQTQSVDAIMDWEFSFDDGRNFQAKRSACRLEIRRGCADSGANGLFETEMLSFNFAEFEFIAIRESPTEPSHGMISLQPRLDGTYDIQSFFDVFFEVSLDGGQTWSAASTAPLRLEESPVATPNSFTTADFPPADGVYADSADLFAMFADSTQVRQVKLYDFTLASPLPAPGTSTTHEFSSAVDFALSSDGGLTWDRYACVASTTWRVSSGTDFGQTRFFDTEMLQLNIAGGNLPSGVMIRESPTRASTGRVCVTGSAMGGQFQIASFFDVFIELSTDGGQTWQPTQRGPGTLRLEPLPLLTIICPDDVTVKAPTANGVVVSYAAPVAAGGCAPVTVTSVPPSGSLFPVGVTTVVITATDACGQTAGCRFTVTVEAPPVPEPHAIFVKTDGTGAGTSWNDAYGDLQTAMAAAVSGDQIWVKAGTYTPTTGTDQAICFELKSGVEVYGSFAGNETLLSQRQIAAHPTILSGDLNGDDVGFTNNGDNSYHVVCIDGVVNTVFDGFTVTAGNADGAYPNNIGGGIYCAAADSTNTLANCTVLGNSAERGGGVSCYVSSPTLMGCAVSGNSAGTGGGLYGEGSSPTLMGCAVSGNSAGTGGGVFCFMQSSTVLTNCSVSGNSADVGGGVFLSMGAAATLTNCTLSGNSAESVGGGLYCQTNATTLTNCVLSGNSAGAFGGAVSCGYSDALVLTNCTLSGNSAGTHGGGIYTYITTALALTNCILSNNTQHAVYEYGIDADPVLTHCLLYGNQDGDYLDEGTTTLTGAAAINALPGNNGNLAGDPKFVMDTPGVTGTWTAAASFDGVSNRTTFTDSAAAFSPGALVGRLVNPDTSQRRQALIVSNTATQVVVWGNHPYAGSGDTFRFVDYRLGAGSAAIDTGTGGAGVPATDIVGNARPLDTPSQGANGTGTEFDIGAYESTSGQPPVLAGYEMFFHEAWLLPPEGVLVGAAPWQVLFASGVIVRDLRLRAFGPGLPLPAPGTTETRSLACEAMLDLSLDGGITFQPVQCSAQMTVRTTGQTETDGVRFFDTEMLQLDLAGGTLPTGLLLRESPTLASTGHTTVRAAPGGEMISSFFDIFTEISLDGGQNWSPSAEPWQAELRGDPTLGPAVAAPTPRLPPLLCQYVSPPDQPLLFANGAALRNVRQTLFTATVLPPGPGPAQTLTTDAVMDLELSLDGGVDFQVLRAACRMDIRWACADSGASGLLDAETVTFEFDREGVMIRESPTLLSRGLTSVQPQADGTYRIYSFFDVFTELSVDGGQSWSPASNGPLHLEATPVATPHAFATPDLLPPPGSVYADRTALFAVFPGGVQLRHLTQYGFAESIPLPAPGASSTRQLAEPVDFELSQDGGQTWQRCTCAPTTTWRVTGLTVPGNTRYFDTEILSLVLTGGTLPPGMMIRESPTRASTGRTSVTEKPTGGQFPALIDSFFDVFTELSVDGGQTWQPALSVPGTLRLEPLPALTITCPDDITIEAPDAGGAVVTYAAPVPAGGFAPVTVTSVPLSGSLFPVGVTTVVCTASDGAGQTAECRFTVTVQAPLVIGGVSPGTATGTGTATVTVAGPTSVSEGATLQFGVTASGGRAPYHYQWTLAGAAAPGSGDSPTYAYHPDFDTVQHPDVSQDKVLACTVTDSGGHPAAIATWQTLRIADVDRPCGQPLIAINPATPQTLDNLSASILQAPTDPDGDVVTGYGYIWDIPGEGLPIAGNPLSHTHTRKGQVWRLTVRALTNPYQAGEVESSNAATAEITIGNTPPEALSPWGLEVNQNGALNLQVGGLDPDVDDGIDTLLFSAASAPAHGTLEAFDAATGTAVYRPDAGFTGNDSFTFRVSDGTAASIAVEVPIYVSATTGWLVALSTTNTATPGVQFGVEPDATPDFDARFDRLAPAAPASGGYTAFINEGNPLLDGLERDMRGTAQGTKWLLEVVSGEAPVLLVWDDTVWDDTDIPHLRLWEVAQPSTNAPRLPGTTIAMDATRQLEVLAPSPRYFVIGTTASFELRLKQGRNMFSLAIEPTDPAVDSVLAAPDRPGVVYVGVVWEFHDSRYAVATELHAMKGYLVYVPEAVNLVVEGSPPATTLLPLDTDWNFVGPAARCRAPANSALRGPYWWWNPDSDAYELTWYDEYLEVGRGYWIRAAEPVTLDFGP